ncbi:lipopolysaccharide biosynthesis protein [Paenibacillus roseipurpureus]|uniref:Lipopolysaccharide biosynthesis protein n=1 Tax=Paenibacillus roseopurpureus TaxID=2918901 RepID=A0AA96LM18_9BACL|nr:lipopolysaccharide biosynthesis protein [Paenibacillus sp. MBLB1832]WNR43508.1 lipopolysaccharide biosynthesis protein [Paenibacillus sp. MBLB1832]
MENINIMVKNAAKWSVLTEIVVKIISPISNMILARMLSPEVFGVVATVIMITSFTDLFTDAGFQKYIIQRKFKNDSEEDLCINVAFWTNLIISVLLWFSILIFSDQIAFIVGNNGLGNVISLYSSVLILTSFSSIQMAIYRKTLNFRVLSLIKITAKLIPFFVTIPLVLMGFSFWALIIGDIVGELLNVILLTALSKWKPKFKYSFQKLFEMFSFCGWTLMEAVSGWLVTNIGIFIIGLFFNNYYLGIYKASTTTVIQIVSILTASTTYVLFSSLAALQNDPNAFNKMFLNFQKYVGLLSIPLGVGIFVFRDTVTYILLGSNWGEATLLIGLWGLIFSESVIFADFGAMILLAKGKPRYIFVSNLIQILLVVLCLLWSSRHGFTPLVYITCLVRLQLPIMQMFWATRITRINGKTIIRNIAPYIFASLIMGATGLLLIYFKTNFILNLFYIVICITIYFSILFLIPSTRKVIYMFVNKFKDSLIL